ncbi:MAG: molybdenum ABC transporter ATP-binding protein [Alphaproteobacteria bacterium]|nr:molybdenum ABC transporter ATP-binding protein [Alphaproteobacteria bacterium]
MLSVSLRWSAGDFSLDCAFTAAARSTALFGPSGAGKSTVLKLIAGLLPGEGEVRLGGRDLHTLPPEQRRLGVVFQEPRLFPHLRVRENLRFGWRRTPAARRRLDPDTVVGVLELAPLMDRWPAGLSGGERRRVALGRALLTSPELLLLDEPLVGLDAARRERMTRLLLEVRDTLETPLLLVSHQVAEVLRLAEEVVVLDAGRVLGQGPFFEVLGRDEVFTLAEALGLENVLPVTVLAHDAAAGTSAVRLGDHTLRLPLGTAPVGATTTVLVRPEDVLVAVRPVVGLSARNALPGTVQSLRPVHGRVLATLDLGVPVRVELTEDAVASLGLAEGAPATAVIKATAIRWG